MFSPMRLLVTARQQGYLRRALAQRRWYWDEQLWSFLTASLLAENPANYIALFYGRVPSVPTNGAIALVMIGAVLAIAYWLGLVMGGHT